MKNTRLTQREVDASFRGNFMNSHSPPMMNIPQIARLFQVGRSTAYRWFTDGDLDFAKCNVDGRPFYRRDQILKWFFGGTAKESLKSEVIPKQ